MSGPKVVRIVTPEERRIIKSRLLARLKHKVESFKIRANKQEILDKELVTALNEMMEHYKGVSEDEYEKLEREIPAQIQYLENEKKKLVKKITEKRTSLWNRYKKAKSTHRELRRLLGEKNVSFEDFTGPILITDEHVAHYQQQVDILYETLKQAITKSENLTSEQKEIQTRLFANDSLLTVQEWSSEKPKELSRLKKFENTLEELYIDDLSQDKIQEFLRRSGELDQNNPQYVILLDSLILEAATFHKEQLELKVARKALSESLEQLQTLEVELNLIETGQKLLETDKASAIKEATEKAQQLYEQISENIIVETRRAAIKRALIKAGYEVNDSMETAWVENGKLVVKKAENSLYGVEFMSPKNLARIQARVVADENRSKERTPSLDKNQEDIWCGEFDKIR
ncbi:MAG: hypothetical protein HRU43_04245, partial [Simkaniaceae bacterium]|nr:hypothetical protein [Simkaniaceae bacterium]